MHIIKKNGLPTIPTKRFEDFPELPFSLIQKNIDNLLVAMYNLIDREWPNKYSTKLDLQILLLGSIKITENTYQSVRYLCADTPEDIYRKPEFAVSISPLARTILDSIFTIVYLFDDLDNRLTLYHKSGWRELVQEHQRYQVHYKNDSSWSEYIGWQKALIDNGRKDWGITDEEANNPEIIEKWPNPGKMARDTSTRERKRFIGYLNDWFYKNLSAASHLSWPGFASRASNFLIKDEDKRLNLLKKYKSDCVITTITLVLALLSEIECEFKFGRSEKLKEVWATLGNYFLETKELYKFRYANMF